MPTAEPCGKQKRRPGSTERVLSALILALIAMVVLTFLVSGGLFAGVVDRTWRLRDLKQLIAPDEDRLFALAPGSLSPPAPPVEIQVGERLLPDLPPPIGPSYAGASVYAIQGGSKPEATVQWLDGWGRLQTRTVAGEPGSLIAAASECSGIRIYRASYMQTKASSVEASIVDAGDPANASRLCALRKQTGATKLSLGRDGWMAEPPSVCGFWAGRYYTEVTWEVIVGTSQPSVGAPDLLKTVAGYLAAHQLVYGGPFNQESTTMPAPAAIAQQPAPGTTLATAGVAQFAAVTGGQILSPTKIDRFTDNLYEKIDGKEGMFRAFNFVELRFGQYTNTRTQQAHDVYIYDMGEPVNAFGIYMGERSPKAEAWPLGRDGYVSGTSAYFCKDKYYVNVLGPPEANADSLEVSRAIAIAIAGTIPDGDEPFWVEEYLPAEGRVPNTLKYEATSGLGYEFLERIFTVRYKAGEKEYQVFLVRTDDPAGARALFDKFVEATAKYDKVLSKTSDAAGQQMVGDSMGVFCVAFTKGRFFGGVNECEDQALAARQAEILKARLPGGQGASGAASGSTNPAAGPAPGEPEEQG